ncbi:MAG: ribonuclease E/G, partial [Desulfobacterales bacterium]|nr:ribonuclease E/G [Desulfobacterales bacterium]
VRQLRLRDMGGLIVLDFIDMRDQKHKAEVERSLKTHVKGDKAKIKIGKISKFGLLEMSRQRLRPSIKFGGFESCRYCKGKGLTPSPETLGVSLLRKLSLGTLKEGISSVKVIVPVEVANYLLNKKRKEIFDMEARQNLSIEIKGDNTMVPGESNIIYE